MVVLSRIGKHGCVVKKWKAWLSCKVIEGVVALQIKRGCGRAVKK